MQRVGGTLILRGRPRGLSSSAGQTLNAQWAPRGRQGAWLQALPARRPSLHGRVAQTRCERPCGPLLDACLGGPPGCQILRTFNPLLTPRGHYTWNREDVKSIHAEGGKTVQPGLNPPPWFLSTGCLKTVKAGGPLRPYSPKGGTQ